LQDLKEKESTQNKEHEIEINEFQNKLKKSLNEIKAFHQDVEIK